MKRALVFGMLVTAALTVVMLLPHLLPPDEIEYRGEKIKLAKWYFGYEHYKLDPQIDPREMPRVLRLVMMPAPSAFSTRDDLLRYGTSLWFPGYGVRFFAREGAKASRLEGVCTVIPPGERWRCLLYRGFGERYVRVDDFVVQAELNLAGVQEEGDVFVYRAAGDRPRSEGREVLRRAVPVGD